MDSRPFKWMAATLLMLFVLTGVTWADNVSVSASLSDATTTIGESVEFHISINGTQQTGNPPEVRVDGLDVQYVGPSQSVSIINGAISSSITLNYMVVPRREGTFTIPALTIQAGGQTFTTQPVTLTVGNAANSNPQSQGGSSASVAFAEWVIPKTTLYVGETVPAELRLYVNSQIRWSIQELPTVSSDGFTVQKLGQPQQNHVTKNGKEYDLVIFKTAVTPVKVGKLTLGPTEVDAIAMMPMRRARRPHLQGVPPGFEDMFNDPFFNNMMLTQQQLKIQTESVPIEVKALPKAGQPKNFEGAIGKFTLTTKASPTKVNAGDPITLTAEISGVGNFDRVTAPRVADEPGWRSYPPNSKFKADDEIGASGTKTFEEALIPEQPKSALPKVEFTYFDPSQEKYITLTGEKIPVQVAGTVAPSPTPVQVASAGTPANSATPAPQKPSDILYRTDAGSWGETFQPVWTERGFWFLQLIPAAALLGYAGWSWREIKNADLTAKRQAGLRQSKADALRNLRTSSSASREFYNSAVRVLQYETALHIDCDPSTIDADAVCASRKLDAETAMGVRRIFAAHDELVYAGAGASGAIAPERQEDVLRTLEKFEKSHA